MFVAYRTKRWYKGVSVGEEEPTKNYITVVASEMGRGIIWIMVRESWLSFICDAEWDRHPSLVEDAVILVMWLTSGGEVSPSYKRRTADKSQWNVRPHVCQQCSAPRPRRLWSVTSISYCQMLSLYLSVFLFLSICLYSILYLTLLAVHQRGHLACSSHTPNSSKVFLSGDL